MAVNNLNSYTNGQGFGLPLNIRRGNPNPLDNSELWLDKASAEAYAQNDPTAYVGQIISYFDVDDDGNTIVVAVQIADTAGTLQPLGLDASDIFNSTEFTDITDRLDTLEGDAYTAGSVEEALEQSKLSVTLDPNVTAGASYDIYQGFTVTDEPVLDASGQPTYDTDGNAITQKVKHPIKIGSIGINQDLFVKQGTIVDIDYELDSNGDKIQATDDAGAPVFEADGITPVYKKIDSEGDSVANNSEIGSFLKLVLSNSVPVYIPTAALGKGMVQSIKTATHIYKADSDGLVDLSTTLSTDDLQPGTMDTWILSGGSAS